jgi:cell wall-associated NlpC family hydrolase
MIRHILIFGFVTWAFMPALAQDNSEEAQSKYHYNKVYDYENDTILTKPFHIDSLLRFANRFIGTPYLSPGRSPAGFDCSGFTFYCFRQHSIYLPYSAHEQAELGVEIPLSEAQAGDLIFFQGYDVKDKTVHHVGIVVNKKGEKLRFIHSPSHGVHYDSMDNIYYRDRFLRVRRVY